MCRGDGGSVPHYLDATWAGLALGGGVNSGKSLAMGAPNKGLYAPWWQVLQLSLGASPNSPLRLSGKTGVKGSM